ncbi:unnamed protein product [Sphagnum troendelagicum]
MQMSPLADIHFEAATRLCADDANAYGSVLQIGDPPQQPEIVHVNADTASTCQSKGDSSGSPKRTRKLLAWCGHWSHYPIPDEFLAQKQRPGTSGFRSLFRCSEGGQQGFITSSSKDSQSTFRPQPPLSYCTLCGNPGHVAGCGCDRSYGHGYWKQNTQSNRETDARRAKGKGPRPRSSLPVKLNDDYENWTSKKKILLAATLMMELNGLAIASADSSVTKKTSYPAFGTRSSGNSSIGSVSCQSSPQRPASPSPPVPLPGPKIVDSAVVVWKKEQLQRNMPRDRRSVPPEIVLGSDRNSSIGGSISCQSSPQRSASGYSFIAQDGPSNVEATLLMDTYPKMSQHLRNMSPKTVPALCKPQRARPRTREHRMQLWQGKSLNRIAMYLDMVVIPSLSCSGANSVGLEVLMFEHIVHAACKLPGNEPESSSKNGYTLEQI